MRSVFDSRFARTVLVTDDTGARAARCFLRPASEKTPEGPAWGPSGADDGRRWLLILEPLPLAGPVTVADGEAEYVLLRRDLIAGHHWAGLLCRKAGDGDAG